MGRMRLYGFMTVKNEADIVAESVTHNMRYLDALVVTDNGSDDGTWDILQDVAKQDSRVHLFRDDTPISTRVFRRSAMAVGRVGFRRRRGDWAVQCDCDELHESDVRAVCEASAGYDLIYGRKWNFILLPNTPTDGPARKRIRWYHPRPHVEHRAYRNPRWYYVRDVARRRGLKASDSFLDLAHYPYRSPEQVSARLATRHDAVKTYDLDWWRRSPLGVSSHTRGLAYRNPLDGWSPVEDG